MMAPTRMLGTVSSESRIEVGGDAALASVQPALTIIVPCYDERDAIVETVHRLAQYFAFHPKHEIVVVDDGSSDGSGQLLDELVHSRKVPNLRVVHHDKNQGYGAALKTGIRQASGELIAITDADGTYPNERLPELVRLAQELDMVVGSRTAKGVQYSKIRTLPKIFMRRWCSFIAGRPVPDMNSGMRVFRKHIAERYLGILPDGFSFTTTITLAMMTNRYRVRFEPITYSPRIGSSKIQPIRDTVRFTQLILRTGMYFAPLRVLGPLIAILWISFLVSLGYDVFVVRNLNEATLLLLSLAMNIAVLALLADMIDKRSG